MKKKASKPRSETDLYRPVHDYLVAQGYTVRSEVMNCDITAVRDDELVVVELKLAFNASLLVQATQRQKITDSVYVALPRPSGGTRSAQWRGYQHLLKRLELGLILVSPGSKKKPVEVVFHPVPFERQKKARARKALIRELEGRVGDFNEGGSTRRKLATAYRENAVHIACCLERHGPLSPKQLRDMGTSEKTQSILYSDFYGWFERIAKGVYSLSAKGATEMETFPGLVEHYRELTAASAPALRSGTEATGKQVPRVRS